MNYGSFGFSDWVIGNVLPIFLCLLMACCVPLMVTGTYLVTRDAFFKKPNCAQVCPVSR